MKHRITRRSSLAIIGTLLVLISVVPHRSMAQSPTPPSSFDEEFNSPSLDPAWQVVPFTGPRVYGDTEPANHYIKLTPAAQAGGTFSATGSLTTARYGHVAVRLQNGQVLA